MPPSIPKPAERAPLLVESILARTSTDELVEPITPDRLFKLVAKGDTLRVASAYYDAEFLEEFLRKATKAGAKRIYVLLHGLGGDGRRQQVDALKPLLDIGPKTQIALASSQGIFHPKLYLSTSPRGSGRAFVGSANISNAGWSLNEELVLALSGDLSALSVWFDSLWDKAHEVGKLEVAPPTAYNFPAFFRTGSLWFRPSATLQLSHSPLSSVLASLPAKQKAALGAIRVPYSSESTGVGPFNIARAVGFKASDFEIEDAIKKLSLSQVAFETSLGYWVPPHQSKELRKKINSWKNNKQVRFTELRKKIENLSKVTLYRRYEKYLDGINASAALKGVSLDHHLTGVSRSRLTKSGRMFINRVFKQLMRPAFVERLCNPLHESPVPEIWDDATLTREFLSAFFGFISFSAEKGKLPLHVKDVLKACDVGSKKLRTPQAYEAAFKRHLKKHGWTMANWTSPR